MINEWGNPDAKFVVLGTDPTAPQSDPLGDMKYPFGLPEYDELNSGKRSIRTRYFYPIYDNIATVLRAGGEMDDADVERFIVDNLLIINAIGTQVKDENGTLLETGESICKKEKGRSVWLNTYLCGKVGVKTHKDILIDRIRDKTVFLTSSYLMYIFCEEPWYRGYKDIDKYCKEAYSTGIVPSKLRHDGNSYRVDFYPLYRNGKYRLRDERWSLYRVNLHKEIELVLSGSKH